MKAVITHLIIFAKLMRTVCYESCVDPQSHTTITIDHRGKIGAERRPHPGWPGHISRHGMHPAHTIG